MAKKKKYQWHRLDHAAKIFPVSSNKSDTKVFRLACQLFEDIDQEILQVAVEETIKDFPVFTSVIKKGLFWYYLEHSSLKPQVVEEYRQPCSPMFDKNEKRLLFEVTYYKKRINLEVYHALADGTGAIAFLRYLVGYYLKIKYNLDIEVIEELNAGASLVEKRDDSFKKYYQKGSLRPNNTPKIKKAYEYKGPKITGYRMRIIEGTLSVKECLKKAHEHQTTLTIFLAALVIASIGETMSVKEKKKSVVLKVPVNLRTYFSSMTARNFFGIMEVAYNFEQQGEALETIINHVSTTFKDKLTKEQLEIRMNKLGDLEHNLFLRSIPLVLKNLFMKIAYHINDRRYTFSLSNVGPIKMPAQCESYIDSFDVFLSTNKQQACILSYKDKLRVSFTSPFVSTELQKNFFRSLSAMGISVIVEANDVGEE